MNPTGPGNGTDIKTEKKISDRNCKRETLNFDRSSRKATKYDLDKTVSTLLNPPNNVLPSFGLLFRYFHKEQVLCSQFVSLLCPIGLFIVTVMSGIFLIVINIPFYATSGPMEQNLQ